MGCPIWLQNQLAGRKGRSIWLGDELVRIQDIKRAVLFGPPPNRKVRIVMKGTLPDKVYAGSSAEFVKLQLVKEGIPEV